MIRAIRTAYGAGIRAGKSPRPLIQRADGTKVLASPVNPYNCKTQFLRWFFYEEGVYRGAMQSLTAWLKARGA